MAFNAYRFLGAGSAFSPREDIAGKTVVLSNHESESEIINKGHSLATDKMTSMKSAPFAGPRPMIEAHDGRTRQ